MLATTHCEPKRAADSVSTSGRSTAAVLTHTLSAPERSARPTSSALRMPPPSVSGMKSRSAVRRATSSRVSRPSTVAEMSRNTTSSAPSAS